jgi:hypothetical protein
MTVINVTFFAEDGSQADVEVDDSMTAEQIVEKLTQGQFIPPAGANLFWGLQIKGGSIIQPNQTLNAAGVENNSTISIQRNQTGGIIRDTDMMVL